jgi:CheY-like chemotaxis protein
MPKKIDVACIIDDDETYIFNMKKLITFKKLCNNILVFGNGKDALNYMKHILSAPALLPDIILLDINMPVMNGWQFMDEFIRLNVNRRKKIHIYMISTSIDPEDVEKAKSMSEISEYIVKPITEKQLIELFEKIGA